MKKTPDAPAISPAAAKRLQLQAQAVQRKRQLEGTWSGQIKAHEDYQDKPVEWIVEFLGVPEHTIRWSLNEEYAGHKWDGDVDPITRILESLAKGDDVGVESATGTGKSAWVDSNVLTPTGWRRMGDVAAGDFVVGSDGMPTEVLAVYPQGVRSIYRVTFSDGAEALVDGEHLWSVRDRGQKQKGLAWRIRTTTQLKHEIDRRWEVPIISTPVDHPPADLPIDPWLLGVLLGDGGFRGGSPTISSADPEIIERARDAVAPMGVSLRHSSKYDYRFTLGCTGGDENPLTARLRDMGLYGKRSEDKHVPPYYMTAAAEQRLDLLRGLMDTDGGVDARNGTSFQFSSTSQRLAEDVRSLVLSLGGTAKVRRKKTQPTYTHGGAKQSSLRPVYLTQIQVPNEINPFWLPRKADVVADRSAYGLPRRTVDSVEFAFNGEAQCIRVAAEDSLYVMDDYIVTHNTFIGACILFWFMACFEDSIVLTAAPREDQLLENIWKEVGRLFPVFKSHFPNAVLTTGKIRMKPDEEGRETWAATAFVCGVGANEESATKAQGFHAEHMLIITEETPGIHSAIMNAFQETRTDDHNLHLAFGNPDNRNDPLHRFCMDEWVDHVRISALDHPNIVTGRSIVPGAIGRKRLEKRTQRLGKDSRLYKSRVRGISPAESENALISWDWCVSAAKKWDDPRYRQGAEALGVDVANSENGDKGAIARWQGACLTEVEDFPCPDGNELGARVAKEVKAKKIDPRYVAVDVVGVGAGCWNEMKRLGVKARQFSSATRAIPGLDEDTLWSEMDTEMDGTYVPKGARVIEAERFDNQRSQAWWRMREDLRQGRIALPDDEELFQDLTTPTFKSPGGIIRVQTKDDIVKNLKRSPNKGDAAVYGNWVRRRRPINEVSEDEMESDMNREYGLEKLIDMNTKRQMAEAKEFRKALRRAGRRMVG